MTGAVAPGIGESGEATTMAAAPQRLRRCRAISAAAAPQWPLISAPPAQARGEA